MAHFRFSAFADEASGSIKEQIAACHKNGIEFIELRNVDGKNISNFTVEEARELKKTLDEGDMWTVSTADRTMPYKSSTKPAVTGN